MSTNHRSSRQFTPKNILVVDPDEAFGQVLQPLLGEQFVFLQQASVTKAIATFDTAIPEAVLLNLDAIPPAESTLLLRSATDREMPFPVIGYSWQAGGETILKAFRDGVFDALSQPLDVQQLRFVLDRASRRSALTRELFETRRLLSGARVEGLLGNSKTIERVSEVILKVAEVFTSVLVTGESGTGKGVVAQAIHRLSARAEKPFVAFAACNFPDTMIEDELFGHEKGAFTGAGQARRGRFEEANGGTIFIDEIGDLALPSQAKLLRALQERTVERLGSNIARPIDVRLICATNRNLEEMVEQGTFREDLYFRISVVKIHMPSLRDRKEDIPLLAEHFLRVFAKTHKKAARSFTPGYIGALSRHSWPGNVRELQNVIERSLVLANDNDFLATNDLPEELKDGAVQEEDGAKVGSFHESVQAFKKELLRSALKMHSGNRLKAAIELGISRCYLHRLLNQFEISARETAQQDLEEESKIVLSDIKHENRKRQRFAMRIA